LKLRERQRLVKYYDASAQLLDEKKRRCRLDEAETRQILESVGRSESLLDVGCGTGVLLKRAHSRLRVGVDLSISMLKIAKRRLSGAEETLLVLADGCLLPFKDDSFERVACQDVISHLRDPAEMASEMVRVCRPRGRLAVTFQKKTLAGRLLSSYIGRRLKVPLHIHEQAKVEKIFENCGGSVVSRRLIDDSIVMIEVRP